LQLVVPNTGAISGKPRGSSQARGGDARKQVRGGVLRTSGRAGSKRSLLEGDKEGLRLLKKAHVIGMMQRVL
jgi:hypothetical protein